MTQAIDGLGYQFHRVIDAAVRTDGTIAVLSAGTFEVTMFGPTGDFVAAFGNEGDGPGEFRRPVSIGWMKGDSLAIADAVHRRMTVLTPTLTLARTVDLGVGSLSAMHVSEEATLVKVTDLASMQGTLGRLRVPQALLRIGANGRAADTIVKLAGFEEFIYEGGSASPPLRRHSPSTLVAGKIYSSDGNGTRIRVHGLSGLLLSEFHVQTDLRVPAMVLDSISASLRDIVAPARIQEVAREMAESIPQEYPGVVGLEVDPSGHLWLEQYQRTAADGGHWIVLGSQGGWLARVATPPRFDLLQVLDEHVVGVRRDTLGVEYVQILELNRRAGPG